MSIKSDYWIKKMSLENDMISPFQPNQVKTNEENNVANSADRTSSVSCHGIMVSVMLPDG